jgi:seryl-tRNA synthetase
MIDLKDLREHPERYQAAVTAKRMTIDIDRVLELDGTILSLQQELEALRAERNLLAKEKTADPEKGKTLKEMLKAKEGELALLEPEYQQLLWSIPNIPSPDSPVGDERANEEIRRHGEPRTFDFPIKDHIALAKDLDLLDFERGVKIHGFRGYVLKNEAAVLQHALMTYAIAKIRARGFTYMIPPILVKEAALMGSGHFPFGKEEVFKIASESTQPQDQLYLAGTSEPSLLTYRSDETLSESELPLRYAAMTPCYRSEVGSYGKDTKGLYRMHEFIKVEQVIICRNNLDEALQHFAEMERIACEILEELGLPYRVLEIATGDMGAGKYKMHDIETWMPSREAYGETHSNSLLTDWQSRRLNIKCKTSTGEKYFPYTLNNTVLASPRILIPILETYQQADGSVLIPEVLRPLCGFDRISPKSV